MKYICYYDNEGRACKGSTLEECYHYMQDNFGTEASVDELEFYEIGNPIEVIVKLIPKFETKLSTKVK